MGKKDIFSDNIYFWAKILYNFKGLKLKTARAITAISEKLIENK